jgi:hypothetical protein
MKAYTTLLVILLGVWVYLIASRTNFDATILKQRGSTYQVLEDGRLSNIYEINLLNKSKNEYKITLELEDSEGEVSIAKKSLVLGPEEQLQERFIIKLPRKELKRGQRRINIKVKGDGKTMITKETSFVGPLL